MRALLVAEREQWAVREGQTAAHAEEVCAEVRNAAYEQATVEHERVLREAAAQGADMISQHGRAPICQDHVQEHTHEYICMCMWHVACVCAAWQRACRRDLGQISHCGDCDWHVQRRRCRRRSRRRTSSSVRG